MLFSFFFFFLLPLFNLQTLKHDVFACTFQKILTTMIPTEEEKAKILEAQMANPDTPLGTAEQFLLTLSSVFELEARLKLWLFKLDYELLEQVL